MKAILIPAAPEEAVEVVEQNGLEDLYRLTGCEFVEALGFRPDVTMYFDEEGKITAPPKPLNERATHLMSEIGMQPGDFIAGDVVLCGIDQQTGDNVSIPDDLTQLAEMEDIRRIPRELLREGKIW